MAEYICPHCQQPIFDDDALLCHFCGESLRRGPGLPGKMKTAPGKWILTLIVLFIVLSFLILMFR